MIVTQLRSVSRTASRRPESEEQIEATDVGDHERQKDEHDAGVGDHLLAVRPDDLAEFSAMTSSEECAADALEHVDPPLVGLGLPCPGSLQLGRLGLGCPARCRSGPEPWTSDTLTRRLPRAARCRWLVGNRLPVGRHRSCSGFTGSGTSERSERYVRRSQCRRRPVRIGPRGGLEVSSSDVRRAYRAPRSRRSSQLLYSSLGRGDRT